MLCKSHAGSAVLTFIKVRCFRKNDMGRPVSPGTDPILYFSGSAFMHKDVIQKSRGVSSLDFYQNQVLHTKVYRGLRGVTSSSGRGAC